MPETVAAFWRMLWEKDVRAVVMVTGLREKGVEKCARYWPTALYNEAEQCGDVQFGEVNVAILAGYRKEGFITSKFRVRCDGAEREVWHFWYDSWPVNYFIKFRSFRPPFFARAPWQIALPPLGGVAAICHRPLGVWHPKKVAKPDHF
jgi:hypothetical protein